MDVRKQPFFGLTFEMERTLQYNLSSYNYLTHITEELFRLEYPEKEKVFGVTETCSFFKCINIFNSTIPFRTEYALALRYKQKRTSTFNQI